MNNIRLLPGVTSGEVAQTLAHAPEGAWLRLEPAVYFFGKEDVFRGFFAPSNNDTGEKPVVFPILKKKGLHLDGGGATLSFTERLFPFVLQDCEDVVLENFTIDFTFPRYAVAEVVRADESGLTLQVDPEHFPFRVENGCLSFQSGSEWRSTAQKKFFLAPLDGLSGCVFLVAGDTEDPLRNLPAALLRTDARLLDVNLIELVYRPGSPRANLFEGQRIVVSHDENRENDLFFLERCRNVTLRNIRILRGAGMGVVGQLCHDLTLENLRIEADPARDEPLSITADAFHFIHCSGKLEIRDCTVRDTLDDAANIHGIYTQASQVDGARAVVRLGHHEQYGLNPYLPGDCIMVLSEQGETGRLHVRSAELVDNGTAIAIEFEENAEALLQPGNYLDNPDRMPMIFLENNQFLNCPRVLLGSPQHTVVRGNRLQLHGAVTMTGGIDYWFESGMSRDACIEDNDFLALPGRSHAAVALEVKGGNVCRLSHRNITILNNRLSGFSLLLDAEATDGLLVSDNQSGTGPCEMRLRSCHNAIVRS